MYNIVPLCTFYLFNIIIIVITGCTSTLYFKVLCSTNLRDMIYPQLVNAFTVYSFTVAYATIITAGCCKN